jgi:hypothetical protein
MGTNTNTSNILVTRLLEIGALTLNHRRRENGHNVGGKFRNVLGHAQQHARGPDVVFFGDQPLGEDVAEQ